MRVFILAIVFILTSCKKEDVLNKSKKCDNQVIKKTEKNIMNGEGNQVLELKDLFNEGSIIKFTPNDLKITEDKAELEFKNKLKKFEDYDPMIDGISSEDLSLLINNSTYFESQKYINSEWLDYFLTKYNLRYAYNELMELAIKQEDLNAVKVLIKHKYIFSKENLVMIKQAKKAQEFGLLMNKEQGYESYILSESKIDAISKLVNDRYELNKIFDNDGYTNLRKEKDVNSQIIEKINSGEHIEVLDNPDEEDWYLVKTNDSKNGYVHRSRIVSN